MNDTRKQAEKISKNARGFSTLELAFVMIVFGTIVTAVMTVFSVYSKQKTDYDTDLSMKTVKAALLDFQGRYHRYPCPANPLLGPGDLNYGREQIDPTSLDCTSAPDNPPGRNGDGDIANTPDPVWVGSIPIATLLDPDNNPVTDDRVLSGNTDLTERSSLDGWNRKLTYAVTQALTKAEDYDPLYGAIDIVDENNQSILVNGKWAHFVVISHGENGLGARMQDGTLVEDCPDSVPAPGPGQTATAVQEITNCNHEDDDDAVFLSGLRNEQESSYNDDRLVMGFSETSNLWTYGTEVETGISQIVNTNGGNVGIGTGQPTQKLHVVGDIAAVTARAENYCDTTGAASGCMPPETLGGDGTNNAQMQCPPGRVAVSISRNAINCDSPFTTTLILNRSCPAGEVLKGISTAGGGTPICCNPSTDPSTINPC